MTQPTDAEVEAVARAMKKAIPGTVLDWTESIVDGEIVAPVAGDLNLHDLARAAISALDEVRKL